jgi:hypothetical protein
LANEDVLQGWMWSCSFSERSCCTCIALHGTIHPIDEDMLEHQSGRCAPVPLTKTWRELGFDVDEPERPDPNAARDWFDTLDEDTQKHILGKGRWELFQDGKIGWDDIPVRRGASLDPDNKPAWRDSYGARTLRDLEKLSPYRTATQSGTIRQTVLHTVPEQFQGMVTNPWDAYIEPHEEATAQRLAEVGISPAFNRKAYGQKNPDVNVGSVAWEFKSPEGDKPRTMGNQFRRADGQSRHLVIDMRRSGINDAWALENMRRRLTADDRWISLIQIASDGTVTNLKRVIE